MKTRAYGIRRPFFIACGALFQRFFLCNPGAPKGAFGLTEYG